MVGEDPITRLIPRVAPDDGPATEPSARASILTSPTPCASSKGAQASARGASYLNGKGAAAGARWRAFVETLNRTVVRPDDLRGAVHTARGVFRLLIDSYEKTDGGRHARPEVRTGDPDRL